MGYKIKQPLIWENVGAGQTATARIPVGSAVYDEFAINYKTNANQSTIENDITEVRVLINERVQRVASSAQIFDIAETLGGTFVAGFLPVYFGNPFLNGSISQKALTLGTDGDVKSVKIEVDIASGASSPVLSGYSSYERGIKESVEIERWKRRTLQVGATGKLDVLDLGQDILNAIYAFEGSAGDISAIKIFDGSLKVYDLSDAENQHLNATHGLANSVSDLYPVVFAHDRLLTSVLVPETEDLRMEIDYTASNNSTLIFCSVGGLL